MRTDPPFALQTLTVRFGLIDRQDGIPAFSCAVGPQTRNVLGLLPTHAVMGRRIDYPQIKSRIELVCDNLNTHTPAGLCKAFEPSEARRLAERFEWR
jgi:hypothetical protein